MNVRWSNISVRKCGESGENRLTLGLGVCSKFSSGFRISREKGPGDRHVSKEEKRTTREFVLNWPHMWKEYCLCLMCVILESLRGQWVSQRARMLQSPHPTPVTYKEEHWGESQGVRGGEDSRGSRLDPRITAWTKGRRLTNWATQVPLEYFLSKDL